ncbi:MAG: hypothetical protein K2K54_10730, partial [Lachnospiraceae bacterium]|nr:hypothetical protein [Lachnospiraceae bacterium]
WWNPFVVLLKRQIATMLELRIDLQIPNSSDPQDQINYLNCLINAAKAAVSNPVSAKSAISLCSTNESLLTQRFFIIMNSSQKKRNRRKQLLFSLLFVGLFFFSIFFIFEPFSIAAKDAEGTFYITPSTAYLIENPDGTYDFYYKNDFQSTLSHVDEALSNLPIYKMEELQ